MTRVPSPPPVVVDNVAAAHEPQRAPEANDAARRAAVLHRGTRFGYAQSRTKPAQTATQTRKRRMPLPRGRKKTVSEDEDDEQGHAPTLDNGHRTVQQRGMGGGHSGGGGSGDQSHSGGDRHSGGDPARVPAVRNTEKSPVPPRVGHTLLSAAATPIDRSSPEYAEAMRRAFCQKLLALRGKPGTRVASVAELQLDLLEEKKACALLQAPEAMATLVQRLIDAAKAQHREKDPFNALVPLIALMGERPLTPQRAQQAANVLTVQRNFALAIRPEPS